MINHLPEKFQREVLQDKIQGDVVTHNSGNGGLVEMSLAWMFRSYCKLWLWLNRTLKWHFLFLSSVIAHLAQFLSLSPTLSVARCPLRCVKLQTRNVSSIICAVSREGERAAHQKGLLLQVWDQRLRPRQRLFPLNSSPLCFLMTPFLVPAVHLVCACFFVLFLLHFTRRLCGIIVFLCKISLLQSL